MGRHVLIHAPDPLAWIRKVKSLLRAGGIAAFQEYDLSYFPPIEPELPLFRELTECLVELFRRAVAYPDSGARLYHWMQLAELSNVRSNAECLIERRSGIALLRVVRRNHSKRGSASGSTGHYQRCRVGFGNTCAPVT